MGAGIDGDNVHGDVLQKGPQKGFPFLKGAAQGAGLYGCEIRCGASNPNAFIFRRYIAKEMAVVKAGTIPDAIPSVCLDSRRRPFV